nr:MAG TPA: hypothetical protein [Crassvirales sp.]
MILKQSVSLVVSSNNFQLFAFKSFIVLPSNLFYLSE